MAARAPCMANKIQCTEHERSAKHSLLITLPISYADINTTGFTRGRLRRISQRQGVFRQISASGSYTKEYYWTAEEE